MDSGWQVIMPCGGFSLVAEPSTYIGKVISYVDSSNVTREVVLESKNIRDVLVMTTGLCVSSSSWTGLPGFYRFVISCKEDDFQNAFRCLQSFKKLVHHQQQSLPLISGNMEQGIDLKYHVADKFSIVTDCKLM